MENKEEKEPSKRALKRAVQVQKAKKAKEAGKVAAKKVPLKGASRRISSKNAPNTPAMPKAFEAFAKKDNPKLERKKDKKAATEAKKQEAEAAEKGEFVPKGERKLQRQQARYRDETRKSDEKEGIFGEAIRLNRFIALAGVCARREADELISAGKIKVNGKIIKEMGLRVMPGKDKVSYKGEELGIKIFVYLLMNKPKNRISTTEDDKGRDTVMEIVGRYTKARVYPVGNLDRNTTGILLFTNDGDITKNLTHPSSQIPKVYQVKLNKPITEEHLTALLKGFDLEDGPAKIDKVDFVSPNAEEVGIELRSGANKIVERMFGHLGYDVIGLDRLSFGPMNKRGLPRGRCRILTEKEVGFLKMLGKGVK